ncbi:MAG: hypothetical protein WC792_05985 [Candidatus Micrarchaeia archaeon]
MGILCGICNGGFHPDTRELVLCEYKGGPVHHECCKNQCSRDKMGHSTCPNSLGAYRKR